MNQDESRNHSRNQSNRITLEALNRVDVAGFTTLLGGVYEHSEWVAARAAVARPFIDMASLHAAMSRHVQSAGTKAQLALIRAHPELAGKAAMRGELTAESNREQQGAGLDLCSAEEFERLHALNEAYNKKFGFPFIVAVRGHTRESILALMAQRLHNDSATEMHESLEQIDRIALLRLQDLVEDTHVTDQ
jgi:2-oxo-4-hydroxy-4-carboxy-5-ureidoimidazoline decarboxylase